MRYDLRMAAVTMHCPVGCADRNLAALSAYAREAAAGGASLVCFPELALTGYAVREGSGIEPLAVPGPHTSALGDLARELGVILLAGAAVATDTGSMFASHLVAFTDGSIRQYKKVHLNPVETRLFREGNEVSIFDVGGMSFGIQLCYDAHFPELSQIMALAGADVLFMPHASPRGTPEEKLESWKRHLPARAFDNGVYVVAVNQCGDNGAGLSFPGLAVVFGPDGKVLRQKTDDLPGILYADLSSSLLEGVRGHSMRYFLPRRNPEAYDNCVVHRTDVPPPHAD
ncbi:MAG: nitrilase-related carbon-nitrogen hydrolase [Desulfatibacillaceae bacterium]